MKNLNERNFAETTTTFDFSTLYTIIPHKKHLKVSNEIFDFCFDGGLGKYIKVNKFSANWISTKPSVDSCLEFDKRSFKQAVTYIMDNCFF